jgi:hypothetical protein
MFASSGLYLLREQLARQKARSQCPIVIDSPQRLVLDMDRERDWR